MKIETTILCGIHGRPSMKNVYSKMNTGELLVRRQLLNETYYRHYQNNDSENLSKVKTPDFRECKVLIRWGIQEVLDLPKNCIVYNNAKALSNISHKHNARKIMNLAGVNVPLDITPAVREQEISYPIIARPFYHSKGKNFITFNDRDEFLQHYEQNSNEWYYSNFIDKVQEFRVHACLGKVLNLLEKPKPNNNEIAWNRSINHEAFENVKWVDYNINVVKEALKACEALKADFVGVDVILDKDGKAWVLECNSAPTLNSSEYSCTRYSKVFNLMMNSPIKMKHWDFRKFKEAKSFAWKNFQLEDDIQQEI